MAKRAEDRDAAMGEIEKIVITGVEDKFKAEKQSENEMGAVQAFTPEVGRMEREADILDRFDDFDSLKIDTASYENIAGAFGIRRNPAVHKGGGVILSHQKKAAEMFLKNLRGFGLLADVVGSGKTFEAGVVLSELCYRGKVGTLLVVVPSEVLSSWEDVLRYKFGMGDCLNVLSSATPGAEDWNASIERVDKRPTRPVLVDLQVFKKWAGSDAFAKNCIFDMIVVDEAHELCNENNITAMSQLSGMIREKRNDGSGNDCYCLMLSATPHNGNLEGMFPLWYFIRRKGGDPREFFADGNTSRRHGDDYLAERSFYTNNVCKGAKNISDFVKNKKLLDFRRRDDGIVTPVRRSFEEHLEKIGKLDEFDRANDWTRVNMIDDFLLQNPKIHETENKSIASAYKELLGLIMIRQPRSAIENITVSKKTVNVYFYPVKKGSLNLSRVKAGDVYLDYTDVAKSFPSAYYPEKIVGNYRQTMFEEIGTRPQNFYSQTVRRMLSDLKGENYRADAPEVEKGLKRGYDDFYFEMLSSFPDTNSSVDSYEAAPSVAAGQYNLVMPYEYSGEADSYRNKLSYVVKILKKHRRERVIIFFDYELNSNKERRLADGTKVPSLYDRLEADLKKELIGDQERLFISVDAAKSEISAADLERFNSEENEDCVLMVKGGYTHGANLQKAAVIINFQVSCDPVDMEQKTGRIFRLGQSKNVTVYSLADMHMLEGYALAYFTGIGLFALDNGDATILSGCNDSSMVCVRCPECQNVDVMPEKEYETYMEALKVDGGYVCRIDRDNKTYYFDEATGQEKETPYRPEYKTNRLMCPEKHRDGRIRLMEMISNDEFVCSVDDTHRLVRNNDEHGGYSCMDIIRPRVMSATAERGKREYYCNKLCALSRCEKHRELFPNCEAVAAFERGESYVDAVDKCFHSSKGKKCPYFEQCAEGPFRFSCMPPRTAAEMSASVSQCSSCYAAGSQRGAFSFECTSGPYVLSFDDKWTCECPVCRANARRGQKIGRLEKVSIKTFSGHIRYLWNNDLGDRQFCQILATESRQVQEIERILEESGNADN